MKKQVFLLASVSFLITSCRAPMPARDRFGADVWEVFERAQRIDAFLLTPHRAGAVAGPTKIASSSRADPHVMHRIWSFMQDHRSFGKEEPTKPVPQYLVRYTRGARAVDLVIDIRSAALSMYPTGQPKTAKWVSIEPARDSLREQFELLFELHAPRRLPQKGT